MKILVLNAGSSSLKFQLFDMPSGAALAKGSCERIGLPDSYIAYVCGEEKAERRTAEFPDHERALAYTLDTLTDAQRGALRSAREIDAVGHRFAHGGARYKHSVFIDDEVIAYAQETIRFVPLHVPAILKGVDACRKLMGGIPQAAVFDTSFYGDLEPAVYTYALPAELCERHGIRAYGFHGTSHRYVAGRAAEILCRRPEEMKIISCHLGSGSSIAAVRGGVAVDTTMGFTPTSGLMMGTRCGSIDPMTVAYLVNDIGMDAREVTKLMNERSGFLGVSGVSSDCRDVEIAAEQGNARAQLALDMYILQIKKYIGAYAAEMNGVDALVFTAGIGERGPEIRERVCADMNYLGVALDYERNWRNETDISAVGGRVKVLVIPTNEELMIARDTAALLPA